MLVTYDANRPTPTRSRSGRGWFIALAVLVLVVVVAIGLVIRGGTGVSGPAGPTPVAPGSVTVCPEAGLPSASSAPQVGDRVSSGKLSYPRLPAPFDPPAWDRRVPFGHEVQSQDAPVETSADGKTVWVASVLIARLLAGDGFFGPQQGAQLVAGCAVGTFYGNAEVRREDKRSKAITLDGHPAWIIESHLQFQVPGIETTGETMIIVVVDTGDGEAGLFYASVPDTSPQFLQPARDSLAKLKVAA